jgi:hypothetical protein
MIVTLIDYLKERLQGLRYLSIAGMAGIVIWSMTVDKHHAHTWAEKAIPGFWGIFGICACILLIFFSRWFGKGGIKVQEDYYDN